ncbi:MAG: lysozyme inhibitor LprI family protein [Oxalicibacterium faecigallinarum]|uniref:Lysozyme inhibitor LprI-like N-terminal domain-containing protein n=1 Tax=Oxalicibacterium faecigallinarum TaxID=573741 RepID=A0A8J3AVX9_9BURK|nr:lysozyme inhibitor LprI family protein [Oxalicibacterium faecigallinarum]MDQ7968322.1 lysozyme inhibitor LprI family protein [Oxalicibacterium faecigallinarum]GGI17208.1 hypothetical protein GCM10008066_07830 [Oxalicibacterium faecigallinarum]
MKKNLLFALALLPLSAMAQQVDPCVTKGSAQEMSACAKDAFHKAEKELNATHAALLNQMPEKDEDGIPYKAVKKQMATAQKSWKSFVEEDCKAVSIYNRGSALKEIEYYSCLRVHTEQRISDLSRFVRKPKS